MDGGTKNCTQKCFKKKKIQKKKKVLVKLRIVVHLHPRQAGISYLQTNVDVLEDWPGLQYLGDLCPFLCTGQAGQVAAARDTGQVSCHPRHCFFRAYIDVTSDSE